LEEEREGREGKGKRSDQSVGCRLQYSVGGGKSRLWRDGGWEGYGGAACRLSCQSDGGVYHYRRRRCCCCFFFLFARWPDCLICKGASAVGRCIHVYAVHAVHAVVDVPISRHVACGEVWMAYSCDMWSAKGDERGVDLWIGQYKMLGAGVGVSGVRGVWVAIGGGMGIMEGGVAWRLGEM